MYQVIILPLAQLDISDAAQWYISKQKGLGKKFINDLRNVTSFIKKHPKSSAIRYDEIRCTILNTFPFTIHYSVDESNKKIVIIAVFHHSINPEKWEERQ